MEGKLLRCTPNPFNWRFLLLGGFLLTKQFLSFFLAGSFPFNCSRIGLLGLAIVHAGEVIAGLSLFLAHFFPFVTHALDCRAGPDITHACEVIAGWVFTEGGDYPDITSRNTGPHVGAKKKDRTGDRPVRRNFCRTKEVVHLLVFLVVRREEI